ncbi:phospholipase A2 inhibitor and Ly6/PLAUR domain-containing protein-like [Sander lucioperca]|uniref:phospholipase A2 inhibitor and Ly6/PLAUR domain-containing protein-like n=1 Tax=Sander lucioperca TaxID=283035 RepID=UPI00125E2939|nr:phospholipase A2 inhibitor and Ly6/PLAUR domain-containing protein-like [Sander lucioperca]
MKLILSFTLIWMLSSTAAALQCLQDRHGHIPVLEQCDSDDELCATTALHGDMEGEVSQHTLRSCAPSSLCTVQGQILSNSVAFYKIAASVHCCNTDGCNSQNFTYPDGQTKLNGLQCLSCTHRPDPVCNGTVQCAGVEDRCFDGNWTDGGDPFPWRGCASANVCEVLSQLKVQTFLEKFNLKLTSAPRCCGSSFCNSAGTVKLSVGPVLLGLIVLVLY